MFTRKPAVVYIGFAAITASLFGIASCGGSNDSLPKTDTSSKTSTAAADQKGYRAPDYYTQCDGPNMVYIAPGVGYGQSIAVAPNDPRCVK